MSSLEEWIIFEKPGYMVVNKPPGVLSQKDKSGDIDLSGLLKDALAKKGHNLPFLAPVHRLDRNTSGLILLAKNSASARSLTESLQEGKINRTYLAIAKGDTGNSGRYEFRLKKNARTNEVSVHSSGDEAITEFVRLQKLGNSSLVRVRLLTGRSHQIRVHFSHAGHALLGDKKYAKKPWSEIFGRPALHAAELELPGEDGKRIIIKAPFPDDMRELLKKLGGKAL
jgi:RluA family pseudouridine synthase